MIPNNRAFNGRDTVEMDGKVYYRSYRIDKQGKFRVKIHIVSINSNYNQGIAFRFSTVPKFKGTLSLNGERFVPEKKQHQNYIFPVAIPEHDHIVMDLDIVDGHLILANASDYLDDYPDLIERISKQTGRTREQFRGNSYASGFTAAHLYGNAFWIEALSDNCYRFHCNDHRLDDDFDDLIFDMELGDCSEV